MAISVTFPSSQIEKMMKRTLKTHFRKNPKTITSGNNNTAATDKSIMAKIAINPTKNSLIICSPCAPKGYLKLFDRLKKRRMFQQFLREVIFQFSPDKPIKRRLVALGLSAGELQIRHIHLNFIVKSFSRGQIR